MSKFLHLIEEFDPNSQGDPKWELIDFLKSKGINVSLVQGTDMVYIDTGNGTIAVNVSQPEEEAEASSMINDIAADPNDKFQQQAAQTVKMRQRVAPKVIKSAQNQIKEIETALRKPVNTTLGY